jgi:hypothetical protein
VPPTPDPPVPPTPTPQKLQIVIVEETGDSIHDIAVIRNSSLIRDYCEKAGHKLYWIDKDSLYTGSGTNPYKQWQDAAPKAGLPYGFLTPVAGGNAATAIDKQSIPLDVPGFLAWLQKYGGPAQADNGCPNCKPK